MENSKEIYYYIQIALDQIDELSDTLNRMYDLMQSRTYSQDSVQSSIIAVSTLRIKMNVLSDIHESLSI
jgi:hypothetical protein